MLTFGLKYVLPSNCTHKRMALENIILREKKKGQDVIVMVCLNIAWKNQTLFVEI